MAKDRMDREERKQLRAPDEFVTTAASFIQWAQANLRTVVMAVAGVLALFTGIGVFNSYQAAQRREANADLAVALDAFRGGDFADAATTLGQLAGEQASVSPLAAVVEANSQLRSDQPDQAIATLSAVDPEGLPPYLRQQRDLVWANALEAKGDLQAAADKYATAAATDGPFTGDALVGQARVRERQGETESAAEIYRKVLDDFPGRTDQVFLESHAG